jgi:hypothetical protein
MVNITYTFKKKDKKQTKLNCIFYSEKLFSKLSVSCLLWIKFRFYITFYISFSTCYTVCKRTAWILIRLRECAGWSGSMLVANPLCWLSYEIKVTLLNSYRLRYFNISDSNIHLHIFGLLRQLSGKDLHHNSMNTKKD